MINLSRIATSPNLAQTYLVHRKVGHWEDGRFIQDENTIKVFGVVTNANPRELFQLPEGDRVSGTMVFYSTIPLFTTHDYGYAESDDSSGTSDEIEWKSSRYRVSTVYDYSIQGFYKAFAVYMEGV